MVPRPRRQASCRLNATLIDRRAPIVPISLVQENSVSCKVEGCIAEVLRQFQRIHVDEMAIGAAEAITRCRTEMNAIGSDRQACLLLRIVHLRQRSGSEIRLDNPLRPEGNTPLIRFPLENPVPIGFALAAKVRIQEQDCRFAVGLIHRFGELDAKDRLMTVPLEDKQRTFRLIGENR